MITSITNTGFLPEPLTKFTIHFLENLCDNVFDPIINRIPSDESQFSIMKDFIFLFVQLSIYGLFSLEKSCVKIAYSILNNRNSRFIKSKIAERCFFYPTISEEYLKLGIIDHINSILPDQIQNTEMLMYLLSIYSNLSYFIIKFDLSQFFQISSESLLTTSKIDNDTINVSTILDILRDRLFHFIEDKNNDLKSTYISLYIDTFCPIILPFLILDNLQQRIHIFNLIDKILNDSRFDDKMQEFFAFFLTSNEKQQDNEFSLLYNLKYHKEYQNSISSIFNCLSFYSINNLDHEKIRQIWINNQDLSSTDRYQFFKIFFSLSNHDKEGEVLTIIIDCVLNNSELTEQNIFEWFNMLDFIIQKLESRHNSVKNQIEMVRQVLWSISFQFSSPVTNFINYNSKIIERARKSLTKIINVEPDEDDFSQIIEMLKKQNDPFLYTLLNEFLKDPQLKISEEEIQSMINQTMNQLMEEFSNPNSDPSLRSTIYDFFLYLCKFSSTSFNSDQIDKLCNLQDFIPDFFSLLLHLSYSNTINEYDLEKIIEKINPASINKTFYEFIKQIIVKVNGINDSNIRLLPLKHENTLWHFATIKTKIRNYSSKFLCKLYSLNDGIELNDKTMIDTFLEHWLAFYSNDPDNDHLLNLLKMFIEVIELQTFRDTNLPMPHQYSENDILVQVHSPESSISVSVPFSAQVGMVIDKVSIENKIDINSIELLINEKKLKRNEFLKNFIPTNSNSLEIHLELHIIKSNSNRNCHIRTQLPSISFIDNPMMPVNEIYKKIEFGNKYAFDLLQVLPTLSFAPDFRNLEILNDLQNVFDTSKPLSFFYNLETLLRQNQISEICQSYDFISYLYTNISGLFESLKKLNISKNNELIVLLIYFLKRASIFTDNEIRKKILYLFVKCALEINDSNSLSMINQILQQTNARNSRIDFPNDDFYDMFTLLILNNNQNIRQISTSIFNYLNIPLTIFLKTIDDFKKNLSVEFLNLFNDHFNDDRKDINDEDLSKSILSLINDAHGQLLNSLLLIILKLITLDIINEKNKLSLLIFLIEKFYLFDIDENDRVAFENASECMSHLSYIEQNSDENKNQKIEEDEYNNEVMNLIDNKDKCCSNKLLLKEVLNLHHSNLFFINTVFSRYMINGDECSISFNQVGLKNIGMICYLNAILQQFYSFKTLRNSIMSYSEDHPLLIALSHLFFLMKYAKTKFINPSFVVEKMEIRTNEFLNPGIQQDAAEIIQLLLRKFTKGKEQKDVVSSLFVGELSHPIDGIDIDYHTETTETFSMIQLEVQDCNDLMKSFTNFSKPELFLTDSQYFAEDLGIKINAKRSTFIKKAPPILIIHLMRFSYNFAQNKKIKITNPFTVFKTIDISDVCTEKTSKMIYKLTGVIVHKGSAGSGHYISFVYKKKKDIWLCFNDENVTIISEKEVLNQASGKTPDSTGYILFYEKEDFDSNNHIKIKPPENIQDEIIQINNETRKAKLMCANGYFQLMQKLALETSMIYFDICLKYTVDTLPFTKINSLNEKYFTTIKNKLKKSDDSFKENFLEYIMNPNSEYLTKSLFYCPYKEIRLNFSKLLLSLFDTTTKLDALPVASFIFQLIDHFWENYQQSDSIFKVLYELCKKHESVKNYASENNWCDKLCDLFGSRFADFRKENPELTASYIFNGMNLTHYLKLIVAFDIPKVKSDIVIDQKTNSNDDDNSVQSVMNGSFFLNICLSSSSTSSIARFAHKYFTANDFLYFLQGNASKLKPFRITSLIYFITPKRATFDLLNFPFKTQTRDLSTSDVIMMMIAIIFIWPKKQKVINESFNDLVKSIMEMAETWLPAFLYNDNPDTRNLCISLCAFLAPCDLFDSNLYEIKIPDDLEIPKLGFVEQRPADELIKFCFQRYLTVCFNSIGVLNEKVKDYNGRPQYQGGYDSSLGDEISSQFLFLISVLLQVVSPEKNDFTPLFSLYKVLTQTSPSNPFNEQSQNLLMLIFKYKMKIPIDILLTPFLRDDILDLAREQEEVIYISLENFLSPFLTVLGEIEVDIDNETNESLLLMYDRFFDIFFRVIVFQSVPFLSKVTNEISSFLKNIVSKIKYVKKKLLAFIDNYFDSLIANNFWGLCIALNALGEIRPEITDFLPDHMDELKNSNININKMVQMAIKSSLSQTINKVKLDEMINRFDFDEETMKMLLSLSYM